jgi:methyl-accepting chemotaxis protein
MNAAIEAAHAGNFGAGFAVVAQEIRHLSDSTAQNSRQITGAIKTITEGVSTTADGAQGTGKMITEVAEEIASVSRTLQDTVGALAQADEGSRAITTAITALRSNSREITSHYRQITDQTHALELEMGKMR